jgi:hypothetical protein
MSKNDETYSLEEANKMIRSMEGKPIPKFSLFDVILLVLYADKESWIFGKIQFMKEIFLAYKEVFEKEPAQQVIFAQYKYGPYSEDVESVADDMAFANYVMIEGTGNSKNVKITPKGIKYIEGKFQSLPSHLQQTLIDKRISWDSNPDIKYYTYRRYGYLDNSVFKERYTGGKWKKADSKSEKK